MKFFRSLFLLLGLAALPACASSEVTGGAQPVQPAASVIEAPAPLAPTPTLIPAAPRSFVVHFDLNSADIRASAMQILYEASQVAGATKPATIRIHGFADGSGNKAYNQKLSERRAKAVADQFAKLGVTVAVVETKGFGKSKAKGKSKDARRVEIVFEGGVETASAAPAKAHTAIVTAAAVAMPVVAPVTATHISLPVALQTSAKHAIKRDRARMGTAWIPPASAGPGPSRMGGRAV